MQKSHSFFMAVPMAGVMALAVSVTGQAAEQAGVAAAVIGSVDVTRQAADQSMAAQSGMDMFLQDRVETADKSRMQIVLLDETVFTVGANTDLAIDEFVYDPAADAASLSASYTKGVFRYVSGKVGNLKPQNVSIKLPSATIGIRGTSMIVGDDPTTENPNDSFVLLTGPGKANSAGLPAGGLTVKNDKGSTDIVKGGYGVRVEPGKAPGPAIKAPPMWLFQTAVDIGYILDGAQSSAAQATVDAQRDSGADLDLTLRDVRPNEGVAETQEGSEDLFGGGGGDEEHSSEFNSSSPGVAPDPRTTNEASMADGIDNDSEHTHSCCTN